MTNLELSNALAHGAKFVLSFITQRKCRDPRDPLRSLITLRALPPMSFTAYLAINAQSYTLVKQEDDQVTDSENTFATQKEMTRTHPNQSLDNLISLIILSSIWQFAAFPYIQAVWKAAKLQNKNLSFKLALLIPTVSPGAFLSTNLILFSLHHIPTDSVAPFSTQKPTHNSSDERLTLETSAFKLFTEANLRYHLS